MTIKLNDAMGAYVAMRDEIIKKETEFKEWKADVKSQMGQIEEFLKNYLNESGSDSASAAGMTAFRTKKDSVKIEDKDAFMRHILTHLLMSLQPGVYADNWGSDVVKEHVTRILEEGSLDIATISANKNNCKQYMAGHDGVMPSGVKYDTVEVVQIRKK